MLGEDSSALTELATAMQNTLDGCTVQGTQSLARHTALRIGGLADLLAVVTNADALQQAVTLCWDHDVPCQVLGAGSNVLVSDSGIRGLVILNRARGVNFSGEGLRAESGAHLSPAARQSVTRGLAGLEWAVGIPGTVGGGIVGNAGAWGGDIASVLIGARVLEQDGSVSEWPVERFGFGYRTSSLKRRTSGQARQPVVLDADFRLRSGSREALEKQVAEITARRESSQPRGATCGSVFRNPPGDHAGRLIEEVGLKGHRSGEAEISRVHANFVINHGNATASDVRTLIDVARREVQSQFGVMLELEIQLLGEW